MRSRQTPYRWLAEHYDTVFSGHHPWADAAQRAILVSILPDVKVACDLACGTGTTALKLAKRGIRTYAVDLSPGMCRATRGRARDADLQIAVSLQDMRGFRLPEQVDLVLCEFDALNHLSRKQDLPRVCRSVARALKPGGYFFFDVNNRFGFQSYWKGVWFVEKPGVVLVMNNGNDARHDRAWSDCTWFLRKGRHWERRKERVGEVCWSEKEIRVALGNAGFGTVRSWDSTPFFKGNPMITPGCRTHYLARRKPGR